MPSNELRRCPHCAEWIQAAAGLCRYCQRRVEPLPPDSLLRGEGVPRAAPAPEPPRLEGRPSPPLDPGRRGELERHYRSLNDASLAEAYALGPEGYQRQEIWQIVEGAYEERSRSFAGTVSAPPQADAVGPIAPGVMCANHATVTAIRRCQYCRAAICETCTFSFPGELYLCPTCATKPPVALTEQRRKYLTWSYIGAAVTTLAIAVVVALGATAGSRTAQDTEAINTLFGLVITVGLVTGLVCGALARPRGQSSPAVVRGAWIWNWVLAGVMVMLIVVGLMMK